MILETHQAGDTPDFSPDGKWLCARAYTPNTAVQVWETGSWRPKFDLASGSERTTDAVFSPDGEFYAVGNEDRTVRLWSTALWDAATPDRPSAVFTNDFEPGSISFSPDGKTLAIAGISFVPANPSHATNRLALWEAGSWTKRHFLEGAGSAAAEASAAGVVAFANDGRTLAIGYRDGWVRLWDLPKERLLANWHAHADPGPWGVRSVSFSNDGQWLASSGNEVVLFDLHDREHPRALPALKGHRGGVWRVRFDKDNRTLVSSGNDGWIKFWNLATREVALSLKHSDGPRVQIAFAPDGNLLVSQDDRGTLKLWPAASLAAIPDGVEASNALK